MKNGMIEVYDITKFLLDDLADVDLNFILKGKELM